MTSGLCEYADRVPALKVAECGEKTVDVGENGEEETVGEYDDADSGV